MIAYQFSEGENADTNEGSDVETNDTSVDIGQFVVDEPVIPNGPVPEEARTDNKPIFYFCQHVSREFREVTKFHRHLVSEVQPNGENSDP